MRVASSTGSKQQYKPVSATEAVETGTKLFEQQDFDEALRLYEAAMDMRPNDDEARAAKYNAACVHVQKKNWAEAVDCLKSAVNEYGLKVSVIYSVRSCSLAQHRHGHCDASVTIQIPVCFQTSQLQNKSNTTG
jgi:tetratricopeptide (TPR) repeat protein